MGLRQYACNLNKELQIGSRVKFVNGFYETFDLDIQRQIEGSSGFPHSIHYVDSVAEMERIGRERDEKESAERARTRERVLQEIAEEDEQERKRKAKKSQEERSEQRTREELSASILASGAVEPPAGIVAQTGFAQSVPAQEPGTVVTVDPKDDKAPAGKAGKKGAK